MWTEVDRQVSMESMTRTANNPQAQNNWRSALELGALSTASEVLSAEIRKMTFPQNRSWFDPHSEINLEVGEGGLIQNEELQQATDGGLRALMAQQHLDFGLKQRVDLSIKEALHHGSYVAEVEEMTMLGSIPDGSIGEIKAPVWTPHSMWNCYPDDSPSVMAGTLFYTGGMIICTYMTHKALRGLKEKGWIRDNISKLEDPKKDHELVKFYGDITIPRQKGDDIYLPNVKAIAIKDKLIYFKANDLPFSPIIYNGYERLDVRNPYYISPLMKMSPTQKITSVLSNVLIDVTERLANPAIVYDGNDPDLVQNGGVNTSPGSQTPSKNMANYKEVAIGDAIPILKALQFNMQEIQKGTSVDNIRSGASENIEKTATEVERTRQGGQVRTIDFLDKHELQGLRPFLYLQHESNKKNMKPYQFYNPEMDSIDFVRAKKSDLPKNVHFDVVGSKGLIEEDQRQARTMQVTRFAYEVGEQNQINIDKILKEMYQDAGNKNPERFLNTENEDPAAQLQQLTAQFQELQQQAQQLQAANQELKLGEETKIQESKIKGALEMAKEDNKEEEIKAKAKNDLEKISREADLKDQDATNKKDLEAQKLDNNMQLEMFKAFIAEETKPEDTSESDNEKKEESESLKATQMMDKFDEMMKEFTESINAPKTVLRDEEGFIIEIQSKLDS